MHPILELRSLSANEKAVVNGLLRLRRNVTQAELVRLLPEPLSQSTISRAMSLLTEKGIVRKTGTTRNARFELSPEARHFATRPSLRPAVPYDPQRIGAYEPNITTWLPEPMRTRMAAAADQVAHKLDASTYSRSIAERFLIDLSWASSQLEGNTYDQLSTEALIRYGQEASGHDLAEATMILNHKATIGRMLTGLGQGVPDAMESFRLHGLLMNGLMDFGDLGRVRRGVVGVTSTSYRPSTDPVQLASDLATLLANARNIRDPFEASFTLIAGLSYLQAFGDGNKRMGRLLCNIPLLEAGLPPLSFMGIDRTAYISGLLVFYETADSSLLAEALTQAYESSAPSYEAAVAGQRIPRSIELRERQRLAGAVRAIVREGSRGTQAVRRAALLELGALPEESREEAAGIVVEMIGGLSPETALLYDLRDDEAAAYLALEEPTVHDAAPERPGSAIDGT